jgi:hypothetical protein
MNMIKTPSKKAAKKSAKKAVKKTTSGRSPSGPRPPKSKTVKA